MRFPIRALQQRMHGPALLRVLVDEAGKPVQVSVKRGSGYLLLDRSAVEQVLAGCSSSRRWWTGNRCVHGCGFR